MIITSTDFVPGREVKEILEIVRGNSVRARHVGRDIAASFRNLFGGEVKEYTKLQDQSRTKAMERLRENAVSLGADAVINVRFTTSMIAAGTSEILAYGTAVKLS